MIFSIFSLKKQEEMQVYLPLGLASGYRQLHHQSGKNDSDYLETIQD